MFTTPDWQSGPYPNEIAQLAATKAGLGLARIPCLLGDPAPTLKRVPPGQSAPCHDVWSLTHKDLISTVRIQTFMDSMSKAFQQKQDVFEGRCPEPFA